MRVRWPTRVRFSSISIVVVIIDDDDDEYTWLFTLELKRTLVLLLKMNTLLTAHIDSLFCEYNDNIINNNNTQVENGF